MIREVINNLPQKVREAVEGYRARYASSEYSYRKDTRLEMCGYAKGLRDTGLLTEREMKLVVIYMTRRHHL